MTFLSRLLLAATWLLAAGAAAQGVDARHDPAQIRLQVEHFLNVQTAGLPGQVTVKVGQIDQRLALPMCAVVEPFLPNGARLWGKTSVGVRCSAPSPWTIYVPASIKVSGDYVIAAAPLAQGQLLSAADLAKVSGDLTSLPNGIITDPAQAIGKTLAVSLQAGAPLRSDAVRSQNAVQQGQTVRLMTTGPGFSVSGEGRALNNATEGQIVQARTGSGQVVSGVARIGGVVEVSY